MAEYNKWINAKEQKPEAYENVLVLFEYYFCGGNTTKLKIGTAYYVKDGDKWLGDDLYALPNTNVIYWQPINTINFNEARNMDDVQYTYYKFIEPLEKRVAELEKMLSNKISLL